MTTFHLSEGDSVRVIKLRESDMPEFQAGSWSEYTPGAVNAESLPVDYELEGWLLAPVEVRGRLHVMRIRRNDLVCLGEFLSSMIQAVDIDSGTGRECRVTTVNSVYRIIASECRGHA